MAKDRAFKWDFALQWSLSFPHRYEEAQAWKSLRIKGIWEWRKAMNSLSKIMWITNFKVRNTPCVLKYSVYSKHYISIYPGWFTLYSFWELVFYFACVCECMCVCARVCVCMHVFGWILIWCENFPYKPITNVSKSELLYGPLFMRTHKNNLTSLLHIGKDNLGGPKFEVPSCSHCTWLVVWDFVCQWLSLTALLRPPGKHYPTTSN